MILPTSRVVKVGLVGLFGGACLYQMIFLQGYYTRPYKEQFREAVYHVVEYEEKFDDQLIIGQVRYSDYLEYYFKRRNADIDVDILINSETDGLEATSKIANSDPDAIWFIAAHAKPDRLVLDFINQNYTVVESVKLLGSEVWLFTKAISSDF